MLVSTQARGDEQLARRAVVTRQTCGTERPPPVALPRAEIEEITRKEQRDRLLVHRTVAEEMWGHDEPDRARKWRLDRPRPSVVGPAKARAQLPHPLVPKKQLRDKIFDQLMTGRVRDDHAPGNHGGGGGARSPLPLRR